ncbi:MAG TPA: PqqD family peptide modification chaperone [Candidatus Moranbacteria bacterium]|nr:PqqD family peptide modification chaperone [Candidatus Moranbacteria bacterium]
MRIKIRKEKNRYLVYFIDSRRIVGVNEIGSLILDMLFNQEKDAERIAKTVANDYKIPLLQAKDDVAEFLAQIKDEIHPDGFNIIEQEQLEIPLGIELEITTSCNLCCRHCFQAHHDGVHMLTEKAISIIGQLANHQVCEVSLIGGEPLKHKGLMDILEYCQSRDMAINLVTNATLIDEEKIKKLAKINRLVIIVSLDGTKNIHNYIRGDGVFDKVDAVLKQLLSYNVAVEVTCTLNSVNLPIYKDVIEYCEKLEIPCNFNLFKPFRPEHKELIPNPNIFFETVADLLRLRRDKGYRIGLSNAAIVTELLGLPPRNECRATRSGMVIDVTGRMVTCPSLKAAGYYREEELPLFDDNFMETWRSHKAFSNFRQNGLRECQARSFIFNRDVHGRDPYGINAFREYWYNKKVTTS